MLIQKKIILSDREPNSKELFICQTGNKYLFVGPGWEPDTNANWPTEAD
jgi:hypothetical protein